MQFNEVQFNKTDLSRNYKYWVASSSFFETALIFYPIYNQSAGIQAEESLLSAAAEIYDCDGKVVNNIDCTFDPNKVSVLEMSSFLEPVKYEAGIKHGLIELRTSPHLDVQCRLISHSSASLSSNLLEVSKFQKSFLPLRLGENTNTLMVVANLSKDPNSIRSKLFIGKRSPEIMLELPQGAVRVFSLATEFAEYIESSHSSLGYLRTTSKNDSPFAMQLIEVVESNKNEAVFSCIL